MDIDKHSMKFAYVVQRFRPQDRDYHPDFDIAFTTQAAKKMGIEIHFVDWRDQTANWSQYSGAIIRSPWDYVPIRNQFVKWAKHVQTKTKLFNSAEIVQWNTQKSYLKQLQKLGIPIVPTKYAQNEQQAIQYIQQALNLSNQVVVKPSIGAGACFTGKFDNAPQAVDSANLIFHNNRIAMIQPYLKSVEEEGEKSIIVIDGHISHVVKKISALGGQDSHQPLKKVLINRQLQEFVQLVKKNFKEWDQLLYARIDVIRYDGKLALMELELTQPSLFMDAQPECAELLLKGLLRRVK